MTYKQFCIKIGGLIRLYRSRKKFHLSDMARELNINYQLFQEYERGDHLPLFYNMQKIVKILDIPGNKIFDEATDKIDLQELSKKYQDYNDIIEALDESKELRYFVKYYIKNKKKFEELNLLSVIKTLAKKPKNKR